MIGEDKLLMTIQLTDLNEEEKKQEISDWAILTRLLIQPTFIRSFTQQADPYDLRKLQEKIMLASVRDESWLVVGNDENECSFRLEDNQLLIKNVLSISVFKEKQFLIRDFIQKKMIAHGVFAYMRAYSEFIYHNTKQISQRLLFEKKDEIEHLPKMKQQNGEVVVDCNQFPGYDYHQIIPKPIFLDIQQVEKVKELENEVICIQLYRDPFNWQKPNNQMFQSYFRDQLGFDHLAWDNGVGLLKPPFVEYIYTDHTIQSVQYQNAQMQPVPKKNASFFVTKSYDIQQGDYKERRVRGTLNAQAYFPWVDENRSRMMCYKVIDPTVALDNGIEAYCYYIREYLEVEVTDEKYQEYLLSLRIYVPSESLSELPLKEIKHRLSDVTFKRIKKKRRSIQFDVKKGEQHLRVQFLDYRELEQLITLQKI